MDLAAVLRLLQPLGGGAHGLRIPPAWHQGRTLYGGLNLALAAAAAARELDDLGPLRAAQVTFMAPLQGEARYVPICLRRGRSVSFIGVDAWADETLATRTTLTYGSPRVVDLAHDRVAVPAVPEPEACPPVRLDPARTPAFLTQMELRFAAGSPPLSGGEPSFMIWVRHRDAASVDALSALLAVADTLPPVVLAQATAMRPASTVTWDVELIGGVPDPAGWYLLANAGEHAAAGYSLQTMACYAADRRPVAVGRQCVAYF